jgi:hypothetical protein
MCPECLGHENPLTSGFVDSEHLARIQLVLGPSDDVQFFNVRKERRTIKIDSVNFQKPNREEARTMEIKEMDCIPACNRS